MKKLLCLVVPCVAASLVALSGCGLDQHPSYSEGIKYGVRQDPLVVGQAKDLGDDRYEPDRPGVLPVMHYAQVFEEGHPYQAKLREKLATTLDGLIDASGKKSADLPAAERLKLQGKFMADKKNQASFEGLIDTILRDPAKLDAKDRRELDAGLEAQFGTPAHPKVEIKLDDFATDTEKENGDQPVEEHNDFTKTLVDLKLDTKTLEDGSKRYRVHCLHCHGVSGDGRGPTSRWINPHPRDFRVGKFKFQSVDQARDGRDRPPSRGDLLRTLRHGIEGTAMPTFNLLADHELESIVSYVLHLSLRGRAEFDTIKNEFDFDKKAGVLVWKQGADKTISRSLGVSSRNFVNGLKQANDPKFAIKPGKYPYPEINEAQNDAEKKAAVETLKKSVLRGQRLFLGDESVKEDAKAAKAANCKQCHDDYGRQAKFKVDDWGTLARPNNFSAGVFRGGRRPVDVYYRIHSGINGSGMNRFGDVLAPDDIWDLVNFVTTLSYPAMREKTGVNID